MMTNYKNDFKYILSILIGIIVIAMCSCSDVLREISMEETVNEQGFPPYRRSVTEAYDIAIKTLEGTRSIDEFELNIIGNNKTRALPDTLAYVFNKNDDKGFVVVSIDKRLDEVLAYSDTGKFTYEENDSDPVYNLFVKLLPIYNASVLDDASQNLSCDDNNCMTRSNNDTIILPPKIVDGYWKEDYPFNAMCPQIDYNYTKAGSASIAAGRIMMMCRDTIQFHGRQYLAKRILEAMSDSITYNLDPQPPVIIGGNGTNSLPNPGGNGGYYQRPTYMWGVGEIALFVSYLGEDINIDYGIDYSSADIADVLTTFQDNNFNVISGLRTLGYNSNNIFNYLSDNKTLIFVEGKIAGTQNGTELPDFPASMEERKSYSFIIDGAKRVKRPLRYDFYFHCDFGKNGSGNGEYLGAFWEVVMGNFRTWLEEFRYVAVQMEQDN